MARQPSCLDVGTSIKALRKDAGFSVKELAALLWGSHTPWRLRQITDWESGKNFPTASSRGMIEAKTGWKLTPPSYREEVTVRAGEGVIREKAITLEGLPPPSMRKPPVAWQKPLALGPTVAPWLPVSDQHLSELIAVLPGLCEAAQLAFISEFFEGRS